MVIYGFMVQDRIEKGNHGGIQSKAIEKRYGTASSLKARFPILYADAFTAPLARINRVPLFSGEPVFASLLESGESDGNMLIYMDLSAIRQIGEPT